MEINYKKNDNKELFKKLNDVDLTNISDVQNYNPLYNKYFQLNNNNYNSINLNHKYFILDIDEKKSYNKFKTIIIGSDNKTKEIETFFKFSPLLDPIKYLLGKYNNINEIVDCSFDSSIDSSFNNLVKVKLDDLYKLPNLNNDNNCIEQFVDENSFSYVDCFFSFLSSKLLNNYGFIHGIDFYGSFLGIKQNFIYNIEDDIEILSESDFFLNTKNLIYTMDSNYNEIFNFDTRTNKSVLKIDEEFKEALICDDILQLNISDLNIGDLNIGDNEEG